MEQPTRPTQVVSEAAGMTRRHGEKDTSNAGTASGKAGWMNQRSRDGQKLCGAVDVTKQRLTAQEKTSAESHDT